MGQTTIEVEDPVVLAARRELTAEQFRVAVEVEKARLRRLQGRSFFQRVLDALPFTITRKRK